MKKKINVKPYRFDKMDMNKDLLEDKLYKIIDEFNEIKTTNAKFHSILVNEIQSFYDGNGRTSNIMFANDDEIIKLIDEGKKI